MWLALGTVYVVWGSTYLAIRIVVESMPAFLTAGVRWTIAGAVLAAWIVARSGFGRLRITRGELRGAAVVGALLLLGGNGFVQAGERDVPSGLAALIVASIPLWVVIYRWLAGERIGPAVLFGVVLGLVGVGILVLPTGLGGEIHPIGLAFVLLAAILWAWGTFISKRVSLPRDALVSTTYQQLLGGIALVIAAVVAGELGSIDPGAWSTRSLLAVGYLIVFGSLITFTAYTWLLAHVPVSKVATYAYVNPVVAVVLGAVILAEPVTPTILVGAAIVVASVAFTVRQAPTAPAAEVLEPVEASTR